MALDVWARTSGTWINLITVALGSGLGFWLGEKLPARMQDRLMQAVALITLLVGLSLAEPLRSLQTGPLDGIILGLMALVAGGLLGEWLRIEQRLEQLGDWLKQRFRGQGRFTEGFVAASLLFCVGPMTLMGSLNNGLQGDNRLLLLKATMDGLAAIALTASYGLGVAASLLTIAIYQGGISLAAGLLAQSLPDPSQSNPVLAATGVGGLMILAIGLNLLKVTKIPVAAFLPALAIAPGLVVLAQGLF